MITRALLGFIVVEVVVSDCDARCLAAARVFNVSAVCRAHCLLHFFLSAVQFWALCQGANIMNPHVELVVLALVDVLFLSACCIVSS